MRLALLAAAASCSSCSILAPFEQREPSDAGDADGDSDTDSDSDTDTDSDTDSDADSDADSDTDSDTDADIDAGSCTCREPKRCCDGLCRECCDDPDCDDSQDCTMDRCVAGACSHVPACGESLCCGDSCAECCGDEDCERGHQCIEGRCECGPDPLWREENDGVCRPSCGQALAEAGFFDEGEGCCQHGCVLGETEETWDCAYCCNDETNFSPCDS